jgi:hypothetical protein
LSYLKLDISGYDLLLVETLLTFRQLLEARPWLNDRRLRRAVRQKQFPFYKVGGILLFDPADIDRYVARCRVEAAEREEVAS